jgi:hypothetical protein
MGWATFWVIFFTNSFSHPAQRARHCTGQDRKTNKPGNAAAVEGRVDPVDVALEVDDTEGPAQVFLQPSTSGGQFLTTLVCPQG